jgi:hypothetical protein
MEKLTDSCPHFINRNDFSFYLCQVKEMRFPYPFARQKNASANRSFGGGNMGVPEFELRISQV